MILIYYNYIFDNGNITRRRSRAFNNNILLAWESIDIVLIIGISERRGRWGEGRGRRRREGRGVEPPQHNKSGREGQIRKSRDKLKISFFNLAALHMYRGSCGQWWQGWLFAFSHQFSSGISYECKDHKLYQSMKIMLIWYTCMGIITKWSQELPIKI